MDREAVERKIVASAQAISSACPNMIIQSSIWYVRHAPWPYGKRYLASGASMNLHAKPQSFVATTQFGCEMSGSTEDLIQRFIYVFGVWEPQLTGWIEQRLEPGDTFVDVGANIGYYSLLAAQCVGPSGHVVAIEASPSIFGMLNDNIRRNGFAIRVRSINIAASDRSGTVSVFSGPKSNIGRTTTVPREDLEVEGTISAEPLRSILAEGEITSARLIKIDVEGLEGPVVRGLLPILPQCRKDLEVIVEVGGQPAPEGELSSDILGEMRAQGFYAYEISNSYRAKSYVDATHTPQERPRRIVGEIDVRSEVDLIFSHIDAPTL